jgi:hypothetical protein
VLQGIERCAAGIAYLQVPLDGLFFRIGDFPVDVGR